MWKKVHTGEQGFLHVLKSLNLPLMATENILENRCHGETFLVLHCAPKSQAYKQCTVTAIPSDAINLPLYYWVWSHKMS